MAHHDKTQLSVEEMAHAFEDDSAGEVDLSVYSIEDWVTLLLFWAMGGCVFLQFFTRYALNNSLAWTEEIASNLLVVIVFLGAVMCVRLGRHIAVDLLYLFLPRAAARGLGLLVDLIVIVFFVYMTWLMWRYVAIVGSEKMVTVDLSRGWVFYTVLVAFALMALRALHNFIKDIRNPSRVRGHVDDIEPTGV